jgi:oligosaccharyltransferase complex subunit beta
VLTGVDGGNEVNMAKCVKVWKLLVIFVGIISIVNAGGETLVLLDNLAIKETHSMFFKSLQGWF